MISFLNSAPFPISSPLSDLKRTKPLSRKDLVGTQVFSSLAEGVFPPPARQSYLIIRLRSRLHQELLPPSRFYRLFLLLVRRIGFDFKARRRVFAFEPAINAVFIARMFVMLFLKDRNAFPSKMRICCALAEDAA